MYSFSVRFAQNYLSARIPSIAQVEEELERLAETAKVNQEESDQRKAIVTGLEQQLHELELQKSQSDLSKQQAEQDWRKRESHYAQTADELQNMREAHETQKLESKRLQKDINLWHHKSFNLCGLKQKVRL